MNEIVPVSAHVRLANLEDGGAIVDLIALVTPHDDANARARQRETLAALTMAADARVLLAERDGVIVGVASLQARASLRSSSIDAQLLAAAEHHARALGCESIVLESPAGQLERAIEPPAGTLAERFSTEAADAKAERAALRELLPLGKPVVSEESGLVGAASVDPEQPWISLDPLDGSRNFVAGYPSYAVSIGLIQHGQPIAGLVADLAGGGHRWSAVREGGAFRDGIVHVHDLAAAMVIIEEAGGSVIDRAGVRPVLVPDPARTVDVVAAYDRASARDFARLA